VTGCVFCAVATGQAERSLVYEDDVAAVVLDLHPVNTGHSLVLPMEHATYLADLVEAAAAHLFVTALRTAGALRRSGLRCEGINLFVADGEAAGQEVFHVHVHVLPRFEGDPFRVVREGGRVQPQARSELDGIAERLRTAWSSAE